MYDQDLKRKWDNEIALASAIEEGLEKGLEKGLEEGLEKGRLEKALEIGRALKATKLSIDEIAKVTGLTMQQIEEL